MLRSLFCLAFLVQFSYQSAIPMWELLTRTEKMNRLFTMFTKQVEDHCYSLNMPNCEKIMLSHGLTNLAKMEDDSLNKMDPYQRGADDIIWKSMMGGNYKIPNSNKKKFNGNNEQEDSYEGAASNQPSSVELTGGPMVWRAMPDGRPLPPLHIPTDDDFVPTISPIQFNSLIQNNQHNIPITTILRQERRL